MKNIKAFKINAFLVISLCCYHSANSQNVGIGTSTPDPSSKLEILSANSGMLIPRVSLLDITNGTTPISSPAISLMVYNTNAAVTGGNGTGYYFWNGTQWEKFISGATTDWSLTGNSGTTAGTNFIGTTDPVDFVAKTNNIERMRINSDGQVGIGLSPSYKLDLTYSSSIFDDRAVNINFSTSDNIGGYNSGLYVNSASTGSGDLFGIFSLANPSGAGNASAITGFMNASGNGDRFAVSSQLTGSGVDGGAIGGYMIGSWQNAYGLYLQVDASASISSYGLFVRGSSLEYSGYMENGNFHINDALSVGFNADPPQAKLHVDGNIKSEFLSGGLNRMLYTDNFGQITPLNNGVVGDMLVIGSSGEPEWGYNGYSQIHMAHLTAPFGYSSSGNQLILSKSFTAFHDTVIVHFNMNAIVTSSSFGSNSLPLFPYEVTLEMDGIVVSKAYGYPNSNLDSGDDQGRLNMSFTVPIEISSSPCVLEVFITDANPGNVQLEINPFDIEPTNATLVIYDMPINE